MDADERIDAAIKLITEDGGTDGAHHKQWVLDQVLRTLMDEDGYTAWLAEYSAGEDGPSTYEWDEGIAP